MTKPRSVWTVVLNWNGIADTLACVRSLWQLRYPANTVVVVDNGSTDGSGDKLRALASDGSIELVESTSNLGYAGGNNLGIRHALDHGAEFILVLNNDTVVDPALLDHLLAAADRDPIAGCFGPWILYMSDPERLWFAGAVWSSDLLSFTWPGKDRTVSELPVETVETDYVCGAALFFRASVAQQIGLLDERFFLVYEESDWCYRARRAGFGCVSVPSARVWHKVGASFGNEESPLRTYFSTRNKLLWMERNGTGRELLRVLRRSLRRLHPDFAIDREGDVPLHKAALWACAGYGREWSRRLRDPNEAARRRGVFDYLLRRFGDCPPVVREWTRAWASLQKSAG